jgi:hypothetical protein
MRVPYRLHRDAVVAVFLSVWPLAVGTTVVVFSDRFTSRSWRFASGMPGGFPFWGGILIACGVLMILAHVGAASSRRRRSLMIGGLILVGLWWLILGGLFAFTALRDPLANPLGAVVWSPIGLLYFVWAAYEYRRL